LYAYTRVRSIFRKLAETGEAFEATSMPEKSTFEAPEEIKLAKHLLNFGFALQAVIADWRPNFLCNYLYDLAGFFARFWEACPVLKAEPPMRQTRLGLCALTGQVLKQGLEALGLETTDKM
jgi:arginyl-tRNA synthetase